MAEKIVYGNEFPENIDIFDNPITETMFYRYLLALHWCRDKDVLDIACGCGYGSNILRTFAKSVTGVDIDKATLKIAKQRYPHIDFVCANVMDFKLNKQFDVVVSIETFEHMPRHEIDAYLQRLLRHCKEGGTIFITTPQSDKRCWIYKKNESHLYEYSSSEFQEIILRNYAGMNYMFFGLDEIKMGEKHQLVSIMTPVVHEGHIMVAVIDNVKHF